MAHGISNRVVDSSSIEVNRRARRAKSDGLDVGKLLTMLIRHCQGEEDVWRVVRVPTPDDEDQRQLHRELLALKVESTKHVNRIKGLLASCGLTVEVDDTLPTLLPELRSWDDLPLPPELHQRLVREHVRWQLARRQIKDLDNLRDRRLRGDETPQIELVRRLMELRAIGTNSAWLFVREFFAWRQIRNRRELAALAGLTPTPYQSGDVAHEQGISKAGNRRMRTMLVEIAWCWLRFQPQSELALWYQRRFGQGNSRQKKIGIVALARKLLVALWKYLERGEVPAGAELTTWEQKVNARLRTAGPPAESIAASCRSFRLGPWVGARVALLRSPILRPGQFRYSISFRNQLGAQTRSPTPGPRNRSYCRVRSKPHRELEGFPRPRFLNQRGSLSITRQAKRASGVSAGGCLSSSLD